MPRLQLDQNSLRFTIVALNNATVSLQQAGEVAIQAAGQRLQEAIKANISVSPIGGSKATHEAALEDLDHPYARRGGSIRYTPPRGGSPGFANRQFLVHTVDGDMVRALRGSPTTSAQGPGYSIGFDLSIAPHARSVIQGTQVMLPRDILTATAEDPRVIREMQRSILRALGESLRAQALVRFG